MDSGLAYAILKDGFDARFMQREVAVRRLLPSLPSPPLYEVDLDGNWFSEQYVTGTPLNRLADGLSAHTAYLQVGNTIANLIRSTAGEVSVEDYANSLGDDICREAGRSRLLTQEDRSQI